MSSQSTKTNPPMWSKVEAALEIYHDLLRKSRKVFEDTFGKPTSYYDAEKDRVMRIADMVFNAAVTPADIEQKAMERPEPAIRSDETTATPSEPSEPTEATAGNPHEEYGAF